MKAYLLCRAVCGHLVLQGGILMDNLFEQYDVIEEQGNKITIPDHFPAIYVSENNDVYCYIGIYLNDPSRDVILNMYPYYMHGKHSIDKNLLHK